jgi:hypothetical protein
MPKNLNGNGDSQSPAIHLTLQGKGGVGKSLVPRCSHNTYAKTGAMFGVSTPIP